MYYITNENVLDFCFKLEGTNEMVSDDESPPPIKICEIRKIMIYFPPIFFFIQGRRTKTRL